MTKKKFEKFSKKKFFKNFLKVVQNHRSEYEHNMEAGKGKHAPHLDGEDALNDVVAPDVIFGPEPIRTICPKCSTLVWTRVEKENSILAWVAGGLLCMCGCVCGAIYSPAYWTDLKMCNTTTPTARPSSALLEDVIAENTQYSL